MLEFELHEYSYFPYEERLAQREIKTLFGCKPEREDGSLVVEDVGLHERNWKQRADRLTYVRRVEAADGEVCIPRQAQLEASVNGNVAERGSSSELRDDPNLSKQQTRYGPHGLHEYRGKFNPQIVRAVGNLLGVTSGSTVVDPFCGSGTTLLEARFNDWFAVGVDINPLAIEISNAKLALMKVSVQELTETANRLIGRLQKLGHDLDFTTGFSKSTIEDLSCGKIASDETRLGYLRKWFKPSVLAQLLRIDQEIASIDSVKIRRIFRVVLSDILRDVSEQNSADLRIRRDKDVPDNVPAVPQFCETLQTRLKTALAARGTVQLKDTRQVATKGDIRDGGRFLGNALDSIGQSVDEVDALITSPPYATALPYIDTQRLSLVFFELVEADTIREKERELIGAREVTKTVRRQLNRGIIENDADLPDLCIDFCRDLLDAVDEANDGFRRQNKPALIYRYLRDMKLMFESLGRDLPGGIPYAMVVGRNETTLGGSKFTIDTPALLEELAVNEGFEINDRIQLDTYHRYDIHRRNSIDAEELLMLETQ